MNLTVQPAKTKTKKTVTLFARSVTKANHKWAIREAKKNNMSLTRFINTMLTAARKTPATK